MGIKVYFQDADEAFTGSLVKAHGSKCNPNGGGGVTAYLGMGE